jgi:hypothetical protein
MMLPNSRLGSLCEMNRNRDFDHFWRALARCSPLLVLFLVSFAAVLALNPAKAGLALWGLAKLGMGGYVGYWIDRSVFRAEDRPHRLDDSWRAYAWQRRSWIVAASIVAAALIP